MLLLAQSVLAFLSYGLSHGLSNTSLWELRLPRKCGVITAPNYRRILAKQFRWLRILNSYRLLLLVTLKHL